MERSNLAVSLPLPLPGTRHPESLQNYCRSPFSDEEVECSINNFSGGYFTDGCIGGGVDIGTGQSHLPFSEVRLSDQYKEICASAMPGDTVLRDRDLTIPIPQEKTDHSTGHNILGFFRVLVQVRFATSKTKYDF